MGGNVPRSKWQSYDPETDSLRPPGVVSPEDVADAVLSICSDPARYREMSAAAHERASRLFSLERFVSQVDSILREAAGLDA
jgi:glycosyltransferase involved in cell wall biosynthesis